MYRSCHFNPNNLYHRPHPSPDIAVSIFQCVPGMKDENDYLEMRLSSATSRARGAAQQRAP